MSGRMEPLWLTRCDPSVSVNLRKRALSSLPVILATSSPGVKFNENINRGESNTMFPNFISTLTGPVEMTVFSCWASSEVKVLEGGTGSSIQTIGWLSYPSQNLFRLCLQ